MSNLVASANPFSILSDGGGVAAPAPTKAAAKDAPASAQTARGGQRARGTNRGRGRGAARGAAGGGFGGGAPGEAELPEPSFGPVGERGRGGRGRGRGGRGRGGPRAEKFDHSLNRHGKEDTEKRKKMGWGDAADGEGEKQDEDKAVQDAADEQKAEPAAGEWGAAAADDPWGAIEPSTEAQPAAEGAQAESSAPVEEVDNTMTLDDYRKQQEEEKRLAEIERLSLREANDGEDPFKDASRVEKEDEDYFKAQKTKKQAHKAKEQSDSVDTAELLGFYSAPPSRRGRGGPERGFRGGGRGRGDRERGERRGSSFRGGRGGRAGGDNQQLDMRAFPALTAA